MFGTTGSLGYATPPDAARRLAAALLAGFGLAAIVLWARRLAGALVEPLPGEILAGLGVAFAGWGFLWRRTDCVRSAAAGHPPQGNNPRRATLREAARWSWPAPVMMALAGAVSLPRSDVGGLVIVWALPLVALLVGRRQPAHRPRAEAASHPPTAGPGEGQTQHWERRSLESGGEVHCGWLTVELPAGQRSATAHIAFCPSLPSAPQIEAAVIEGASGTVEVAQVLAWGARLEVRLEESCANHCRVRVEVTAHAGAADDG